MKKEKKKSNFMRLMAFADKRKFLMFVAAVGSFVSALIALIPLIYIFFIIRDVINVAPNFAEAVNIVHYAKMAVLFSIIAMLAYFGSLMCSHLVAFRISSKMFFDTRRIKKIPLTEALKDVD